MIIVGDPPPVVQADFIAAASHLRSRAVLERRKRQKRLAGKNGARPTARDTD
jgi:hypothetical protein